MGRSRASDSLSSLLASWRSSGTCGLVIRADQCRPQWASHPSVRDRRGALLGLFQGEGGRAARAQSPQLRPVGSQMANTNLACESESRSVMSDSLRPHGLLQSMEFSRPEYWTGSLSLLQGIFPTQGLNPGSPTLWADSLPDEPQGKPRSRFGVWFYVLMEVIFLFLSALWVIDIKNDIWYMKSCVRNF